MKKKTRKSVAKRFKRTATGKILHGKPGRRHLAASKNRKRKRHLRREVQAQGAFAKALAHEMGA